ncbi:MAG: histone deacetylase family protein [Beijerinckiaceae bacterium]
MTTLLVSHAAFVGHAVPEGHPERPDRLMAVGEALSAPEFSNLSREEAVRVPLASASLAHDEAYVATLLALDPATGFIGIDNDTFYSPGSREAVERAMGGAKRCVDAVMTGQARNAFLAARPPGHHAERDRAMGFCFVNTAAFAARHARTAHGATRVAIFDWDVHHGNGTQDIFFDDAAVLYASTHEMPLYPGTGSPSETGTHGNIVNVALRAGTDGAGFREAVTAAVLPRIAAFKPDLIIISAGFDAHHRDPLASLELDAEDFAWATTRLMEIADKHCGGRIVSVLEGGYDLEGLSSSAAAHVRALMAA